MLSELVKTTTRDALRLDGALFTPSTATSLELDACLLLHGVGGNFYGGNLFEFLTPKLLELGIAILRVNTRGHDAFSWATTQAGPSRQGSAYEIVDHCRNDVAAWVDFLVARGFQRVGLFGHSLGAVKAIYSQAYDPHAAVKCILAASPPRLSYSAFQNGPDSSVFFEAITTAQQHVQAGRAETLFQTKFPVPLLVAAAAYLDKYGSDERYNVLRFVDRLTCPLLVTYGQRELESGNIAFAGMHEAIRSAGPASQTVPRSQTVSPSQTVDVFTIANADHFYSGVYDALGEQLVDWLQKRFDT